MNFKYSVLLSDKFSYSCNLLLGFQMPSSATAGTACAHNPVFRTKMTELLNEMISRSVCLFLGSEKRCPFLKTLWLNLHLDQTAVNLKCRECCDFSWLPALLEKVNEQGGDEQCVLPCAEGEMFLLWKGETFRVETAGERGDIRGRYRR